MESQKGAMQEAIVLHLKALTDPEKNLYSDAEPDRDIIWYYR